MFKISTKRFKTNLNFKVSKLAETNQLNRLKFLVMFITPNISSHYFLFEKHNSYTRLPVSTLPIFPQVSSLDLEQLSFELEEIM